jgi:hypothetical protein
MTFTAQHKVKKDSSLLGCYVVLIDKELSTSTIYISGLPIFAITAIFPFGRMLADRGVPTLYDYNIASTFVNH